MSELVIPDRFCGPPGSANGGYVAGLLLEFMDVSTAEVRLSAPPRLNDPLHVSVGRDQVTLMDGATPVATARPSTMPDQRLPDLPAPDTVSAASARFTGFEHHGYPGCYVCGPERKPGDGLRIFAGPVDTLPGLVAAPWTPADDTADDDGRVWPRHLGAALDCPGYFSAGLDPAAPTLLGTMTLKICQLPVAGDPLTVLGWAVRSEGRKHLVDTALFSADRQIMAVARSLWITLRPLSPA